MSDFWAVLSDLYTFIHETLFGKSVTKDRHASEALVAPKVALLEPRASLQALPERKVGEPTPSAFGMTTTGFIVNKAAKVFSRPVWAFDTVVSELTYGTKVGITGYQGRFVQVTTPQSEGWVLKDEVTVAKEEVWPELIHKTVYLAADTKTELIRAAIGDEFFAAELYLPLRTEEFVTYRLKQQGRKIVWGSDRPRLAGLWHELLKGRSGIFMSLEPKTASVMEAYGENGEAFLAYVLAVQPDNTIQIESVGEKNEGEYQNETVPKSVWHVWRPVFIQVT
jgi:hypothetical protein